MVNLCFLLAGKVFKVQVFKRSHSHKVKRVAEERRNLYETPTGRNNKSMRINKPLSYQEIQRIKEDLGDYLEDPGKYTRTFKGVTLLYDLTWKDVMYIL